MNTSPILSPSTVTNVTWATYRFSKKHTRSISSPRFLHHNPILYLSLPLLLMLPGTDPRLKFKYKLCCQSHLTHCTGYIS